MLSCFSCSMTFLSKSSLRIFEPGEASLDTWPPEKPSLGDQHAEFRTRKTKLLHILGIKWGQLRPLAIQVFLSSWSHFKVTWEEGGGGTLYLYTSLSISPPKTMITPLLVVLWFTCEHHILQSSLWPRVLTNQFILKLWAESHPSPCFGFSWFSVSNVRNGGTWWNVGEQEGSRVTAWGHSMISVYHWAAGSQLEPIPCLQS